MCDVVSTRTATASISPRREQSTKYRWSLWSMWNKVILGTHDMSGSKWVASNNEFIRDAIKKKKKKIQTHTKKRTFSVESGKKLMPFGITSAIRDEATTRHVSKNAFHVRSCSLCRQPYGQPRMTVFGFMPPNPHVWTLAKIIIIIKLIETNEKWQNQLP